MSKMLSDRLEPYLAKSVGKDTSPKHSMLAINQPVPMSVPVSHNHH